jgi:hypothetical protein
MRKTLRVSDPHDTLINRASRQGSKRCPEKPANSRSSCQRQMPFDQHITPRIPRILPSSVDTVSRVLPASTHWRSARCQRCNPAGVCPVCPETPPLTALTPATPTNSNALPSTLYARRSPSDCVRKTGRMGGQTPHFFPFNGPFLPGVRPQDPYPTATPDLTFYALRFNVLTL